jgi:hypothetical protein
LLKKEREGEKGKKKKKITKKNHQKKPLHMTQPHRSEITRARFGRWRLQASKLFDEK